MSSFFRKYIITYSKEIHTYSQFSFCDCLLCGPVSTKPIFSTDQLSNLVAHSLTSTSGVSNARKRSLAFHSLLLRFDGEILPLAVLARKVNFAPLTITYCSVLQAKLTPAKGSSALYLVAIYHIKLFSHTRLPNSLTR